jgi:hypothetical protein
MGTGPEDLQLLLEEFLDACIASLDTIPLSAPGLGGAPARSFISPGQSADDCCPQLTVWAQAVSESPTSPGSFIGKSARDSRINVVSLFARIIRCVDTGTDGSPPDPVDQQASSEQINADGWALWNHLFNMVRADLLFTLCGEVFWDGLRSITPSGGCGGWILALRVELDGYEESL